MKNRILRWLTLADVPVAETGGGAGEVEGVSYTYAAYPDGRVSITVIGPPGEVRQLLLGITDTLKPADPS